MIGAVTSLFRQRIAERKHKNFPRRTERIGDLLESLIHEQGLAPQNVLEIGGRRNPYKARFGDSVQYRNMDFVKTGEDVILGDITHCPEIPDNSFDLVFSVDVFEHIQYPWKAASEISRILRPGGLTFHSTLFAWRYHPCPADYFRYTPEGLKSLFSDLTCVRAEFDDTERRRNIKGNGDQALELDAFGGWRENWRVHYAGRKR
ncbi:class I SAM-dependent methyltransferase [Sneathiella chinensis]|uniref:Methyltransferase type 11 domain-containing protein n=1 Tax=Sneathiella chinensis TaxID=349750 RepID=A0ABQ5U2J5_9PROT|nr:class I SAM-dependent methyltransferase [Sneathiella chinensis]GLQ06407.1 hypothetical protein GCM10007924_16280 [Sneathiella chinensis]